jgi:hypothetical protein
MESANGKRRRARGSAWYWKQTGTWYHTPPGTKQRVPLVDECGKRIRGLERRRDADLALARIVAERRCQPEAEPTVQEEWLVARVCSTFIEHSSQRAATGNMNPEYATGIKRFLNDLCAYCGALPVSRLKL